MDAVSSGVGILAQRLERLRREASVAADAAQERALAARRRRMAAAARLDELRRRDSRCAQRSDEDAVTSLSSAMQTAAAAYRAALEELEWAAVSPEHAARAHDSAAIWAEGRGDPVTAAMHRHRAAEARAAADEARETARLAQ